tara:strand:- start:35 stop:1024 length:990 start_codon:yes stop_codon:yes gene_type:complete
MVKYVITEMGFEGKIPESHENMRVLEAQIVALDAYHLPLVKVLQENKTYEGDALVVLPKGNFKGERYKELWVWLYNNHFNTIKELKGKFNKVYFYQDGVLGWWNMCETRAQVWWYNNLQECDKIYCPNINDISYYKGLFPDKKIGVVRSIMLDTPLDKTKFLPKQNRTIIAGPFTYEYLGLHNTILSNTFETPIDVPPMGSSRMPEDSYDMASSLGVNYLQYMNWKEWMYNLSQYKYGMYMMRAWGSASFALNCAYFGIPCIGNNRADTQIILFPELSFDVYDTEGALKAAKKLKNDKSFYKHCSNKALTLYKEEFTKEKFINIFNKNY